MVRATREPGAISLGASPRATVAIFRMARAGAAMRGRDYAKLGPRSPRDAEEAQAFGADLIAISALMTSTMPAQREVIKLLNDVREREAYGVLVGGAGVSVGASVGVAVYTIGVLVGNGVGVGVLLGVGVLVGIGARLMKHDMTFRTTMKASAWRRASA